MKMLLRLLLLARPHWGWMVLSVLVSTAATLANIGLMATSGWFITAMGLAGVAGVTMNYFTPAALIRALAIVRTGGRYLDRLASHETTLRLLATLRVRIFAGLVPLVPFQDRHWRSADLAGRISSDVDRLELVFLRLIMPVMVALLTMIVVVAGLAWVSGALALVALGSLLLLGLALPALTARADAAASADVAMTTAALRNRLVDDLDGLAPLLLNDAWPRERARLVCGYADLLDAEGRQARSQAVGLSAMGLATDLSLVAMLMVGVPLVRSNLLAGPDLTLAVLALLSAFEAFASMPDAFASLRGALASARRLFDLLDRPPSLMEPAEPLPVPERFDLTFETVSLVYPGSARPALDGLMLEIGQGAFVAITGESGAGKSSLAQLLVRFCDPSGGRIRLGGLDLRDLASEGLRRVVVAVPQASYLLSSTVRANLCLARPEASEAELLAAAGQAEFGSVLARLPLGLDTEIGVAGAHLSGGEARRLAIARALLADPKVLVLDEPLEGLDGETARRLLTSLAASRKGRTTIVITHQLAGAEVFDRVITLADGRLLPTD
ncbi:thiol reductant ABC exporter subunit CydC [Oryzibacter oryziterrae]|uniref:thiol reductant ABC exporter subunit CydC n=1 Tax=Oryzibacter oryziterrae TaxID=2766474 RepID=UPI001EFFD6D7|nr:thiol reductant ABC exporter subunit CydC [Oryzibacter oryziterrae]